MTETPLLKTPLYNAHIGLNAKMVGFGGWQMPVQYEGILAEYEATRRQAALFDTSHMGEFIIEGDYKDCGLDRCVTMSLGDLPVKSCRYGFMLNAQGGVLDDLIVFRLKEDQWYLVVNAGTQARDASHIKNHLKAGISFTDVSKKTGKLDLQGPLSREILSTYIDGIKKLDYYTFDYFDLFNQRVIVSRTGYTGELGYEVYLPSDKTSLLWEQLLSDHRVTPAGLGARDVLRLEVGYPLYGHELRADICAGRSGFKKFIDLKKDFIGKEALLQDQNNVLKERLVGLISSSRRAPREGHRIFRDEIDIGFITSGSFSPYLNKGIGLGYIQSESAQIDEAVYFGDQQRKTEAQISGRIFFKKGSLRN